MFRVSRRVVTTKVLGLLLGIALCFSCLFFSAGLTAQTKAPPLDAQVAKAGMIVMKIGEFDLQKNTFSATFWVWITSDGERGDDLELVDWLNATELETLQKQSAVVDGEYWNLRKMRGTFATEWDLRNFPVDRQNLTIRLEATEKEIDAFVYEKDSKSPSYLHDVDIPGWSVGPLRATTGVNTYRSNFGDPRILADTVSKFSFIEFNVEIRRKNHSVLLKVLAGALASSILVFASYGFHLVIPSTIPTRFSLLSGSVFAVVLSLRAASSKISDPPYITSVDIIHLFVVAYIIVGVIAGMVYFRGVHVSDGSDHAFIRKCNKRVGIVSTTLVAISVALTLLKMFLHF